MLGNDEADRWALPWRKPTTREVLDRAMAAEEAIASRKHQLRHAWFDRRHDVPALTLTDGPKPRGSHPSSLGVTDSSAEISAFNMLGIDRG